MRDLRTVGKTLGRKNIAVLAALGVSALAATPLVLGASRALATSGEPAAVTASLRVAPVEVSAPSAAAPKEACLRKVRVVYGGYGNPDGCAAH